MTTNVAATAAYSPAGTVPGNVPLPIAADPRFQELVRSRNGLAYLLTTVMMAIYLAFILTVAFNKPLLATKVFGTTSLGIVLGLVVIVLAFVLTAVYVLRANSRFDELNTALVRDHAAREYGR